MAKNCQSIEMNLLLTIKLEPMMNELSIYDSVKAIKCREQKELAGALRKYGTKVGDGYEFHFESDCPIIAAYDYDEPCDVVILAAKVNSAGFLTLIADLKNDRGNPHEIDPDDVFAGHLEYVTSEIA